MNTDYSDIDEEVISSAIVKVLLILLCLVGMVCAVSPILWGRV